jgi:hypothetical protein
MICIYVGALAACLSEGPSRIDFIVVSRVADSTPCTTRANTTELAHT